MVKDKVTHLNTVVMHSSSLSVSMWAGAAMLVLTLTSAPPGLCPSQPRLSAFSRSSWALISWLGFVKYPSKLHHLLGFYLNERLVFRLSVCCHLLDASNCPEIMCFTEPELLMVTGRHTTDTLMVVTINYGVQCNYWMLSPSHGL